MATEFAINRNNLRMVEIFSQYLLSPTPEVISILLLHQSAPFLQILDHYSAKRIGYKTVSSCTRVG